MTRPAILSCIVLLSATVARGDDPPKDKPKPRFTIGKETTFITEPLDKDGYPDYQRALNEHLRKGVTPANNAVVKLCRAFGPRDNGKMPAEFYKLLGIEEPPEKGQYFFAIGDFCKTHFKVDLARGDEIEKELDQASRRPWKAKDFPHLAEWLKLNETPLVHLTQATKCSRYFLPLTSKERHGLFSTLVPGVSKCQDAAAALACRATFHLAEGRRSEAWEDMLSCHRLARLIGQGEWLIQGLVAVSMDTLASKATVSFLDRAKLNSEEIRKCLTDLQSLPSLPKFADRIDRSERLAYLDSVQCLDRYDIEYLDVLFGSRSAKYEWDPPVKAALKNVSWDAALRAGNVWFDRLVSAMTEFDRDGRKRKLDEIDRDMTVLKTRLAVIGVGKLVSEAKSNEARGLVLGDLALALTFPNVRRVLDRSDSAEQTQHNLHLAFALAAHKLDSGAFPKTLDALAPKYLPKIPLDIFTGKQLIYRLSETGYLLYSLGPNGKDDEGRDEGGGDDVVVRMPQPSERRTSMQTMTHRARLSAAATVLLTMLLGVAANAWSGPAAKDADLKALQGVWHGWVVEGKGVKTDAGFVKLELKVKGDVIVARRLGGSKEDPLGEGTFTITVAGDKKEMDAVRTSAPGKGQKYQGIYSIDKGTLRWCVSNPSGDRPTEMISRKGQFLIVLKRQADEKK